jgi:hypothetical protein
MNNECHLYRDTNSSIIGWVVVLFSDLQEFVDITGSSLLEDDGLEVTLKSDYIAVELNELIEYNGEDLIDYKECFGDEWKEYFEEE